jgi:hypothetical protein
MVLIPQKKKKKLDGLEEGDKIDKEEWKRLVENRNGL